MTDQTLPCREAFEKWDAQDNGVVSRWKVWKAACEWMNTRAQSSAPKRDRPSSSPGGCECMTCGCVFVGDESHTECGTCHAKNEKSVPEYDLTLKANLKKWLSDPETVLVWMLRGIIAVPSHKSMVDRFWNGEFSHERTRSSASEDGEAVADDIPKNDREMLEYLMEAFDSESWQCPRCGHDEDTATMDSAYLLRDYLAKNTRSNAQGGVPFDRIDQIIKMMQAYRYEADEYKGRYITSSWETMLGALMTEFGAPGYTALSTSRSNDKGTEGG